MINQKHIILLTITAFVLGIIFFIGGFPNKQLIQEPAPAVDTNKDDVKDLGDHLPFKTIDDHNDVVDQPPLLDTDNIVDNLQFCQTDDDCVPEPTCHAEVCINKKYLNQYPDIHTFRCTEELTPCEVTNGGCQCLNSHCVNSLLRTTACKSWKERVSN